MNFVQDGKWTRPTPSAPYWGDKKLSYKSWCPSQNPNQGLKLTSRCLTGCGTVVCGTNRAVWKKVILAVTVLAIRLVKTMDVQMVFSEEEVESKWIWYILLTQYRKISGSHSGYSEYPGLLWLPNPEDEDVIYTATQCNIPEDISFQPTKACREWIIIKDLSQQFTANSLTCLEWQTRWAHRWWSTSPGSFVHRQTSFDWDSSTDD